MPAELELKLEISPESVGDFLEATQALGWRQDDEQFLANCYFDTPDQALQRERIALRVRKAGGRWIQTLKTAGTVDANGISHRGEWEWEVANGELDTKLLGELLPASIDSHSLTPRFTTDFKRVTWIVQYQESSVEVALDIGEICAANQTLPISEVELELKAGAPESVLALAELLKQHVELRVSTVSKAERAQQLLAAVVSSNCLE